MNQTQAVCKQLSRQLSFAQRAARCKNAMAKKLLHLLDKKKSLLALSADTTSAQELLALADLLGPEICVLKTHMDIIEDFTPALSEKLRKLADQHHFLLFEDRKFADIGNTVRHQLRQGIYHIADWADLINAHSLPGPGVIEGLTETAGTSCGLLLIAQMSCADNLLTPAYTQASLALAEKFPERITGFIAQQKISENPCWITLTPGIQIGKTADTLGQRYITPHKAITENGSDIIIVGRGILQAKDPLLAAQEYRHASWQARIELTNAHE